MSEVLDKPTTKDVADALKKQGHWKSEGAPQNATGANAADGGRAVR